MTSTHASTSISPIGDTPVQMAVDTEHIGTRTLMPILVAIGLIGGFVVGGVIAPLIDQSVSTMCVSLIMAGVGVLVMAQVGERVIKPLWPSHRQLVVDRSKLILVDRRRDATDTFIHWDEGVGIQAWHFAVPTRRSRVPRGWYCISVRLVQGETSVILYTFMKLEIAQQMEHYVDWFIKLHGKREREEMTRVDPQWAAQQERFRRLESQRWHNGAELSAADFLAVMELVNRHGYPTTRLL